MLSLLYINSKKIAFLFSTAAQFDVPIKRPLINKRRKLRNACMRLKVNIFEFSSSFMDKICFSPSKCSKNNLHSMHSILTDSFTSSGGPALTILMTIQNIFRYTKHKSRITLTIFNKNRLIVLNKMCTLATVGVILYLKRRNLIIFFYFSLKKSFICFFLDNVHPVIYNRFLHSEKVKPTINDVIANNSNNNNNNSKTGYNFGFVFERYVNV